MLLYLKKTVKTYVIMWAPLFSVVHKVFFEPIIGLNHYWQEKLQWRNSNFTASLFLRVISVLCAPVYKGRPGVNKTDKIVDFFQMIFKIITQNRQTSNTSASQNNNQRQHQKTFRIFWANKKVLGGWDFPKTKTRDTEWEHRFMRSQTASARLGFRRWNLSAATIYLLRVND